MSVVNIEKLEDEGFLQIDIDELLSDDVLTRRLRMEITKSRKKGETTPIRCGLCKEPIYLRRNYFGECGYHFCHFRTDDPVLKSCPQRTENHANIELMRCLKYKGAKESRRHYRLKHLIAELLKLDPSVEPDTVKTERVLSNESEWRRPDVQAIVNRRLIAFEVQVSTEMAEMIVAREHFYENFGSIIWVLPNFNPDDMNQSQRDIQTTNNEHLFVLNDEMQEISRSSGLLTLEVWINWPLLKGKSILWEWRRHVAPLSDISFSDGHAYLLDIQAEEAKIRKKIKELLKKEIEVQQLDKEREADRHEKEWGKPIANQRWDEWWVEFIDFCEKLIDPSHRSRLRKRLVKDNVWSKPTSSLSGLWLALHGVYIEYCECTEFVIKALLCASKGELDYGYSSWKYIANGLIKDHLAWFSPFYKVLKLNVDASDFSKVRGDCRISRVVESLKRRPILLKDNQRKLLGLIEPNIGINVSSYSLRIPDSRGPSFSYAIQKELSLGDSDVCPPDLNIVRYYMKRHMYGKLIMGRRSNNIINVLKHLRDKSNFVPFPNIPIANADSRYYIEYAECNEILPAWKGQLSNLEKEFR